MSHGFLVIVTQAFISNREDEWSHRAGPGSQDQYSLEIFLARMKLL